MADPQEELDAALAEAGASMEDAGESVDNGKGTKLKNKLKTMNIWKIVGIGAGIAFVGILIWALTRD